VAHAPPQAQTSRSPNRAQYAVILATSYIPGLAIILSTEAAVHRGGEFAEFGALVQRVAEHASRWRDVSTESASIITEGVGLFFQRCYYRKIRGCLSWRPLSFTSTSSRNAPPHRCRRQPKRRPQSTQPSLALKMLCHRASASVSRSRRHKGSLSFNLDDHPSMRFTVNLEFNLFILLGSEKRRARWVLCGDDTQIRVVLVAR